MNIPELLRECATFFLFKPIYQRNTHTESLASHWAVAGTSFLHCDLPCITIIFSRCICVSLAWQRARFWIRDLRAVWDNDELRSAPETSSFVLFLRCGSGWLKRLVRARQIMKNSYTKMLSELQQKSCMAGSATQRWIKSYTCYADGARF